MPAQAGIAPSEETPAFAGVTKGGFAASAVRLSGQCAVVLGWTPEVFWGATPAEVGAVASVLSPPAAAPVDGALLRALRERLDE